MGLVKTGTGFSEKEDIVEAFREASEQAREKIGTDEPKLLIAFHTFSYPLDKGKEIMDMVKSFFSEKTPIIGGSVAGVFVEEICRDAMNSGGEQKGVSVLALDSEYFNVGVGIGTDAGNNPSQAGRDSLSQALENLDYNPSVAYTAMLQKGAKDVVNIRPVNGIVLSPGLIPHYGGSVGFVDKGIVEGMSDIARRTVRLTGGGVCGGIPPVTKDLIPGTMYFNGEVHTKAVISCVFGSDLEIGYGAGTGFKSTGEGFFITKGEGWVIEELNGQPAWPVLYEKMKEKGVELDPKEAIYPQLALKGYCVAMTEPRGDFVWPRTLMFTQDEKSIISNASIPEGTPLALVKISKEDCMNAMNTAVAEIIEDAHSKELGFVFLSSCSLRGTIMGPEYFKEAMQIKKIVGEEVPVFGLASTGEIAFHKTGDLMNGEFTFNVCGITNKLISEL